MRVAAGVSDFIRKKRGVILIHKQRGCADKDGVGGGRPPGGGLPAPSSRADRSPTLRQIRRASRKLLIILRDPAPRKGRISLFWA